MEKLRIEKRIKCVQRSGQSFLEYSFMIGMVVIALIGMHNYLNRSYQGKLKESVDKMGGEVLPGSFVGSSLDHQPSASAAVRKSAWSFSYEDKRGYTVEVGGRSRTEVASLLGEVFLENIPDADGNTEVLSESQLAELAAGLSDGSFDGSEAEELEEEYANVMDEAFEDEEE